MPSNTYILLCKKNLQIHTFLIASLKKRMKIWNKKLWLILAVPVRTKTTMMKHAQLTKPSTSKTTIVYEIISHGNFAYYLFLRRLQNDTYGSRSVDSTGYNPSRNANLQHRFPRRRHSQMHDQNCNVSYLRVNICAEFVVFKLRGEWFNQLKCFH